MLHRRKRWGRLPRPPQKGKSQVPHARSCRFLCDLDDGELAAVVVGSRAWQETFKVYCDDLDQRKIDASDPGSDPDYAAWEYEAFFTFMRVCGYRSVRAARRHLTSEEGSSARYLLGFDYPRDRMRDRRYRPRQLGKPYRQTMDGVPSDSGISRHRKRISEEKRLELWVECLRRLIRYHAEEFPPFREELRLLGIDGITMKSVHKAPIYDPETGDVVNASQITKGFEGGAAIAKGLPPSKRGHGYLVVVVATLASRCVAEVPDVRAMPGDEKAAGLRLIEALEQSIKPFMGWDAPGVLVMDGAFFTKKIFRAAYRAGYIPQVHKVAHPRGGLQALGLKPDGTPVAAQEPEDDDLPDEAARNVLRSDDIELVDVPEKLKETRDNYLKHLDMRWEVKGSPGWYANGLREFWCIHGVQATGSRPDRLADGSATSAVLGHCDQCGPLYVTAGKKRISGRQLVDVLSDNPADVEDADWSFGDPLTYNDLRAADYGAARFANLEGLLGNVKKRYNVFTARNRCKKLCQAKLMVVQTFAIQHAIAMHYRRCVQAAEDGRQIPQPEPVPGSIHAGEQAALAEAA